MGSSTCYSVATSPVTITVQSELNAGSIAADQTICNGATPATITGTSETSTGTISYKWEAAVSPFSTWNEITAATGTNYTPGSLAVTTEYRRTTVSVMGSSTCYSVATSPVTITVQSELNAGSIAADQTICNGATPATITERVRPAPVRSVTSGKQRSVRSQRGTLSQMPPARTSLLQHSRQRQSIAEQQCPSWALQPVTLLRHPRSRSQFSQNSVQAASQRINNLQRRNTGNDHRHD